MLDPVPPECFHARFPHAVEVLEAGGGLAAFRRLDHHMLIAFDGTEYFRSAKLHCPRCSTRKRSGGTIEYFHTLMAATLVAPGHNRVVPLQPEFVVPQDGHDKQDCESRAARRWLAAHGASYARLDPVYLGDVSTLASRSAGRCGRRAGIFCSSASRRPIRPSRST
jgi:hypothetical protein